MARRPILVLSVSVGAGHIRCAEAVLEALLAADPTRSVEHVDVLELAPAWVRRFYRESFLRVAELSRGLAYRIYVGTDGAGPDEGPWGHAAERIMFRRFRRFLAGSRWSDAVCTHFLPLQLSHPHEARPMHLVVTDWDIHRFWAQPTAASF
ncbi:MAG TPA: hypothetical protein VF832_10865, partial [Longimicrobiales bacterium]